MANFPNLRMRRLRHNHNLRSLIRAPEINKNNLIMPLFIKHELTEKLPISSMPGQYQLGLDHLAEEIKELVDLGIKSVILFGIPNKKDLFGSDSYDSNGIIQQAISKIKEFDDNILVISDLCLCGYTDHGHCGVMQKIHGHSNQTYLDLDNDKTLEILQAQALSHVIAGADVVAPSGMIDGMVGAIRQVLDQHNYSHIPILSYAVKYASVLYGPFRDAAEGAPKYGDRRTYQLDPASIGQAIRECELDLKEGADMLMVKPALSYLDIIKAIKDQFFGVPLGAYQVSGEYAMIKAAAQNGWLDETKVMLESITAIQRAGADFIITYFAKDLAKILA